jgi:pyruvate,water dikinase
VPPLLRLFFTVCAICIIQNFDHLSVFLSIAVQKMVACDRGSSGVMFTLDPDSGFPNVVLVNAAFGLGEAVVQGQLDPDEFWIFKPTLQAGLLGAMREVRASTSTMRRSIHEAAMSKRRGSCFACRNSSVATITLITTSASDCEESSA